MRKLLTILNASSNTKPPGTRLNPAVIPLQSTVAIQTITLQSPYSSAGLIGLLTSGVKSITGISKVSPNPVLNATAACALR